MFRNDGVQTQAQCDLYHTVVLELCGEPIEDVGYTGFLVWYEILQA